MLGVAATMADLVGMEAALVVRAEMVGVLVAVVTAVEKEATEALKEGRCSKRRCRASSRL